MQSKWEELCIEKGAVGERNEKEIGMMLNAGPVVNLLQ